MQTSSARCIVGGMQDTLWQTHPSWRGMVSWYLKALILAAAGVGAVYLADRTVDIGWGWIVLAVIAAIAAVFGIGYLKRYTTTYTITPQNISETTGILNTRQERAAIEKVTNITIDRSLAERIMGIGRINIDTANDSADILVWWGVPNPARVEQIIDELRIAADE